MPNELIGQEKWQEDRVLDVEFGQGKTTGNLLYATESDVSFTVDSEGILQMHNNTDKLYYFNDGELKIDVPSISGIQVYEATHDREGNYLSYMSRAFISFSYGGKNIEDFSLISTIDGDRLNRQLTPNFEDHTSTYEVIDGQFYWGTHFTNNGISFTLSTDGMTELELDAFLNWFQPGQTKELILAEHPNRAIMARVAAPPQMALLPFKEKTIVRVAGEGYETSTTKYKGSITLEMIMDEPFWYAKYNLLDKPDSDLKLWKEFWVDANGNIKTDLLHEQDALKILKEDLIPLRRMLKNTILLGDTSMAGLLPGGVMVFATSLVAPNDWTHAEQDKAVHEGDINNIFAVVDLSKTDMEIPLDEDNGYNIIFPRDIELYLYYCGTAPSYPTLRFKFFPVFDSDKYIIAPASRFSPDEKSYNTITLESTKKNEFNFTLPSFFYFYNVLIEFLETVEPDTAWITVREYIRENIKNAKIRQIINTIIDDIGNDTVETSNSNVINSL